MGRKDPEFRAVFCDGPAGDRDATLAQHLLQSRIGVGFVGGFAAEDFRQKLFCAGVGDGGTVGAFPAQGGGKKVAQGNNPVRGADVFVRDGPADGGLVDSNFFGHLAHRQGVECGRALGKVVGLSKGDDFEKFLQRFLPTFERLKKKAGGADSLLEVRAGLFIGSAISQKILVDVADPKAGKKVAFDLGNPPVPIRDKGGLGPDNEVGTIGSEGGSRPGRQAGDGLGGGLDRFEGDAKDRGNFGKFAFSKKIEMFPDDPALQ